MIAIDKILAAGCRSKLVVGIGLPRSRFVATRRRLSSRRCSVELLRFEDPHGLVASLRSGEIDAAVRGTLSSAQILKELKHAFGLKAIMRAAVLESASGMPFILAPVGIDEGLDYRSRLELARRTLDYFSAVGWSLRIGVLSKGRAEDRSRGEGIRRSIEDGERLVRALCTRGYIAAHFHILVEEAARGSDLIIAPEGVTGNLMFRTLHFVGNGRAFGAPVVNLDRVFVDTSRSKSEFDDAVLLAAGLAKLRSRARSKT